MGQHYVKNLNLCEFKQVNCRPNKHDNQCITFTVERQTHQMIQLGDDIIDNRENCFDAWRVNA